MRAAKADGGNSFDRQWGETDGRLIVSNLGGVSEKQIVRYEKNSTSHEARIVRKRLNSPVWRCFDDRTPAKACGGFGLIDSTRDSCVSSVPPERSRAVGLALVRL